MNIGKVLKITFGLMIFGFLYNYLPESDSIEYFNFADKRQIINIPNFLDVISNLGFLIFGILGFVKTVKWQSHDTFLKSIFYILSLSLVLVSFCSSYFHLDPTLVRLFWDRLPMTVAFSSVISLYVYDHINNHIGKLTFKILLPLSILILIGWSLKIINLKPYIFLQFGGLIFVCYIGFFFNGSIIKRSTTFELALFYGLAKIFELFDQIIFNFSNHNLSGHSIKHILAAFGGYAIFKSLNSVESKKF